MPLPGPDGLEEVGLPADRPLQEQPRRSGIAAVLADSEAPSPRCGDPLTVGAGQGRDPLGALQLFVREHADGVGRVQRQADVPVPERLCRPVPVEGTDVARRVAHQVGEHLQGGDPLLGVERRLAVLPINPVRAVGFEHRRPVGAGQGRRTRPRGDAGPVDFVGLVDGLCRFEQFLVVRRLVEVERLEGRPVVGDTAVGLDPERHRDEFVVLAVGQRVHDPLREVLHREPVLVGQLRILDELVEVANPPGVVVPCAWPQAEHESVELSGLVLQVQRQPLPELVLGERVERDRDTGEVLEVWDEVAHQARERVLVHPEHQRFPLELLPVDIRLACVIVEPLAPFVDRRFAVATVATVATVGTAPAVIPASAGTAGEAGYS